MIRKISVLGFGFLVLGGCEASAQRDPLPPCEWCGADEAPAKLTSTMTLAEANEPGVRLVVTGTVYFADQTTPAPNVLVYAYQTNAAGVYPNRPTARGNGQRHGSLRGWLRTDSLGRYRIITIKPGPYPGRPDPMHIHLTVTPPHANERYIDDVMFHDDPRLTPAMQARNEQRGGPGIVTVRDSGGVLYAVRNIWLSELPPGATPLLSSGSAAVLSARTTFTQVSGQSDLAPRKDLRIDAAKSVVTWKGTKFGGRGSHEGIVPLLRGVLSQCGTAICGGQFDLDMTGIQVTDIPVSDPIPRNGLTEHLKSADFFYSSKYPTARFAIQDLREDNSAGGYIVTGQLTLRDATESIRFPATVAPCGPATCVDATVSIDRRRWGISYRFDPIRNLIVDDMILITLHVVVPGRHTTDGHGKAVLP